MQHRAAPNNVGVSPIPPRHDVSLLGSLCYAAPAAGTWFFYIPMWSILPGLYAKYFGLTLTSIASVVLFIRVFDGVIDTAVGYLSDLHRSRGGSRKSWVVAGCIGVIIACYRLFSPPTPATTFYYFTWSIVFFFAFTLAEIPHLTWGSELSMEYHHRTQIFSMRNLLCRVGIIAFYAMPLFPTYFSGEYTPLILRNAFFVGVLLIMVGLAFATMLGPEPRAPRHEHRDNARILISSVIHNKPLLIYFLSYAFLGLAGGMWFALVYFYLGTFLHLGDRIATIFLVGYLVSILSTFVWVRFINRTSKTVAWAVGTGLFITQMIAMLFVSPGTSPWISFALVAVANVYFCCNDIAAVAIIGDIVDYGKLKFKRDRGATYFAINILIFKFGLGIGGGAALALAGLFGFNPTHVTQTDTSILGLKLGFAVAPAILASIGLTFVLRTPINRRKHEIIRRRLEWRVRALGSTAPAVHSQQSASIS